MEINKSSTAFLLRLALAALFAYFGFYALKEPAVQAEIWMAGWVKDMVKTFVPLTSFMVAAGALQIAVAFCIISGLMFRAACVIGALFIFGVIINLDWNQLALRDFVALSAILFLFSAGPGNYRVKF